MKYISAAILSSVGLICMTICCLVSVTTVGSIIAGTTSAIVMIFSSDAWWAATKHE